MIYIVVSVTLYISDAGKFWINRAYQIYYTKLSLYVGKTMKNFCYFTNWSNKYANFDARFDIRDINATLCSHLIYAFAKIDYVKMRLARAYPDDDNGQLTNKKGRFFEFNKLKINYPHLVTLLSIGGQDAAGFQQVVANKETMVTFVRNVAIYLRDRDFDGIDIDWEWPGDTYRSKFTTLLKVMVDSIAMLKLYVLTLSVYPLITQTHLNAYTISSKRMCTY